MLIPAFRGFTAATGWSRADRPRRCRWPAARDVPAATQAVADAFAAADRGAPEDWHALQPIWTADRRPAPVR